jgi:hypothetical protein
VYQEQQGYTVSGGSAKATVRKFEVAILGRDILCLCCLVGCHVDWMMLRIEEYEVWWTWRRSPYMPMFWPMLMFFRLTARALPDALPEATVGFS